MRSRVFNEEDIQANLNNIFLQQNQASSVSSSSSRRWSSALSNPRIVRVSRTFGGKDRHSKVWTVRGLRDRRIRLSVPTAIQVYDLQDRLGLSQPSKVIDWLLEAAKDEVDKLPPLQIMYPNLIFGESSSAGTTRTQRECFDLDHKGKWIKHDDNSNQDHGFDINHYNNNNASSNYYNLGHLQHSLEQSRNNVTVAISNVGANYNNLNLASAPPAMSFLFPTYPSFLGASHHNHHVVDGAGNLQLFSSNANTASQQQMLNGNSSLIRPPNHNHNASDT